METILKIGCKGEFRRALLPEVPSFAVVDHAIRETWPGRTAKEAKYRDEENDLCTLSEQTFVDFLATSRAMNKGKVLRLELPESFCSNATIETGRVSDIDPWIHVAFGNGLESDSESLHELVDLTEMNTDDHANTEQKQEQEDECDTDLHCRAGETMTHVLESDHEVDKDAACDELEEFVRAETSLQSSAIVYSIHTPPPSPASSSRDVIDCGRSSPEEIIANELQSPASDASSQSRKDDVGVALKSPSVLKNNQSKNENNHSREHSVDEMVDIIIVAFDRTGDGHLNFEECNSLQKAAWGGEIPLDMFQKLCSDMGEDPQIGLGRDALLCVYCDSASCSQIVSRDFQVAKRKLEGQRHGYRQNGEATLPRFFPCAWDPVSFLPRRLASTLAAHLKRQNVSCSSCRMRPLR